MVKSKEVQALFLVTTLASAAMILMFSMLMEISYRDDDFLESPQLKIDKLRVHGTASSLVERLKMYKERYNYRPAEIFLDYEDTVDLCGDGPTFDPFFSLPMKFRSREDEDLTIYNLFFNETKNPTKGSIVEIGAFNGYKESNSHFFNTCLGWETLLIEGNPSIYHKLLINRPNAHRFNFVPTCTEEEEMAKKTIKFHAKSLTNAGLADGSVTTAYTELKLIPVVEVPCGSFTQVLLDCFPNGHVSFFSLDVEGSEPAVVANIDFEKVFIEVMIIENWNLFCEVECESRDKYRKIMKEAGYIMFDNVVKKSDLFIHHLSRFLEVGERATAQVY